ncbi:MAG: hypothetical protein HN353_02040 [Bdellovibrionales bacterium]|nr:hypothetical protein [Bdellovibrionales bacterium]MBT3524999.1 hypothetical protein [Bdellovibrionales bacterium]MBT7669166.1 hypothetical protein [Bdellovibrionales bacterium]
MIVPKKIDSVVIFGGGGLVGRQIARQIAKHYRPSTIVLCALFEHEAKEAASSLQKEFPTIANIHAESGNLFVRENFSKSSRQQINSNATALDAIYHDVFDNLSDDPESIDQQNLMGKIIRKYRPNAVIDCVNTATAISYQDVKSSSMVVKEFRDYLGGLLNNPQMEESIKKAQAGDQEATDQVINFAQEVLNLSQSPLESFPELTNLKMLDLLLISQSVPQLVRHVILLHRALIDAGSSVYLKVGTTGTGGMGVNIPFTHGEDKPSFTLMAKSSVGFAHTGLLFLLARSPGPIIKEIKPGAMIGYRKVDYRPINKFGGKVMRWESKREQLTDSLTLRVNSDSYQDSGPLNLVGIDTGENGFFSRGEFEAITYLDSMEFVTPEEIARNVLCELSGDNTGKDVIAAIDGSVMDPSYRGGYIRNYARTEMIELEKKQECPSVAIGILGPPQLSKLLYEAYLLGTVFQTIDQLASSENSATQMSQQLETLLDQGGLSEMVTSLGLPILLSDGKTILRGPKIQIPESKVHATIKINNSAQIDSWARQGWVDLRPENMQVWKERAQTILEQQEQQGHLEGSSAFSHENYTDHTIEYGTIVGWILSNELEGHRIK